MISKHFLKTARIQSSLISFDFFFIIKNIYKDLNERYLTILLQRLFWKRNEAITIGFMNDEELRTTHTTARNADKYDFFCKKVKRKEELK